MRERLERILTRWGQTVVWHTEEKEISCRAFLQPVLAKKEEPMWAVTPLGAADQRRWTYLGGGGVSLKTGMRLTCQGMTFVVREAMPVYLEDGEPLYWWAAVTAEKENAE